ncbi:hypothetical protein CENSYa_0803 [Cenarchaeum symbiosum A]|uniref:Uncharacterized protein n=1 Tax=Cenarchaeum symbiosum (strain A) TaxID=414004 RepID=A0RVR9_CENSY|nr:hypothetical protein CENSYa_0803 [Cenarchaeum symbiosum A]
MRPIPKTDEERIRMMQEIVHSGIIKMYRVRSRFCEEEFTDHLKGIMNDLKDLHTMEQELKKMRKMFNAMEFERQKKSRIVEEVPKNVQKASDIVYNEGQKNPPMAERTSRKMTKIPDVVEGKKQSDPMIQ